MLQGCAKKVIIDLCDIIDWYHEVQQATQVISPFAINTTDSVQQLINEAYTFTHNGHYTDALQRWEQVRNLDPNHHVAEDAIAALQQRQQQKQAIKKLRLQLTRRMKEIRPIFNTVVKRLNNLNESNEDEMLLETITLFIDQKLSAEDFIDNWEVLTNPDALMPPKPTPSINYKALVGRIQRSELILFLGAGIAQEYDTHPVSEHDMAQQLAENVEQQALQLPLSSIAEYYDLRNEYGRTLLLNTLHKQLPQQHQPIEFYTSLAQLKRPLLLISTAYDDLLAQAFDQYNKPYVELSSLMHRSDDYDIGNLIVRYSDKDSPIEPIGAETLSELNLLEQNYSIIYKMRGTCRHDNSEHHGNALTLMESDYFRFARYAERMIPSYIGKQFHTRDFLLLGCQPQQWEDSPEAHLRNPL